MTLRLTTLTLAALALLMGGFACGDDGDPTTDTTITDTTPDTVDLDTAVPDATGPTDAVTDTGVEDTFVPIDTSLPPDVVQPEECELAVNTAHAAALQAMQPALGARARDVLTTTTTFASLGDTPSERCPVVLQFKDSNDNGALDAYEDWTLPPAERAADLVARMTEAQKIALFAHPSLNDSPTTSNAAISSATAAHIADGVRFGRVAVPANTNATVRATWANAVQEAAEDTALGVPFVLSMEPAHSSGNSRVKAGPLSRWPHELGLGATNASHVTTFGEVVNREYRALGVRMALSVSANLATDPRWYGGQFSFGEDSAKVSTLLGAYVDGLQGDALDDASVAAVVSHFPGAGAAKGGFDGRLAKGKLLTYPGDNLDAHLAPFEAALSRGAGAVMPAHGVLETGAWSALDGLLDGTTIEQVGASFNAELLTDALRGHYAFGGPIIAPPGVLDDAGGAALGAPWGVESLTKAQRAAKAIDAGVDQFLGLADVTPITAAKAAGDLTDAQLDASATRVLALPFALGLFEDPFVDETQAAAIVGQFNDTHYRASLNASNASMVLIVNKDKPEDFLNGDGDGTQTEDKGNAGNGTMKVLPAPPGEPYVAAGCAFFVAGNIDLDYVRSVSAGYGELTNDAPSIGGVPVTNAAERMANSDYVFVRVSTPFTYDADSGSLGHATASLEYAGADNADALAPLAAARAAIDATPGSQTQIIVGVDAGRASVLSEILAYDPAGVYVEWSVTDKVFLDVAFGIVSGSGRLPVGLPLSNAAAASQLPDVAGDGQHGTFVEGFGISTTSF